MVCRLFHAVALCDWTRRGNVLWVRGRAAFFNLFTGKTTPITDTPAWVYFLYIPLLAKLICIDIRHGDVFSHKFRYGTFQKTRGNMVEKRILELDSVDKYNDLFGLETLHPLVSVVDLRKAARKPDGMQMNYGLYALYLKCTKACALRYGRRNYDYQEGTIVSFAPGQVVQVGLWPAFPSGLDTWYQFRKEHPQVQFLFLFIQRGLAPFRTGKRYFFRLPSSDRAGIGTW